MSKSASRFPLRACFLAVGLIQISLLTSCVAGGELRLDAKNVRHPVSASPVIYTEDGGVLLPEDQIVLKHFYKHYSQWTMFYTTVDLSPNQIDISTDLDAVIDDLGGSAIVNFNILPKIHPGGIPAMLIGIIPIFPSAVFVWVEGDVIKPKNPETKIYHTYNCETIITFSESVDEGQTVGLSSEKFWEWPRASATQEW